MSNLRKHGQKPFNIAVIHGGPGAREEMYEVARELSSETGILEPLQTASSVEDQVEELKNTLENFGNPPLILIGFSWGAWLSYILTAYHPKLVKKLILISSGPFEDKYAAKVMETRLSRLNAGEKKEALILLPLNNSNDLNDNGFIRFAELMDKADSFEALSKDLEALESDLYVYQQVWRGASRLRSTEELLQLGERIQYPVVAIHGDYDPHPSEGVKDPLSRILKDFRFILLEKCGYYPWLERNAKDDFYRILRREIRLHTLSD